MARPSIIPTVKATLEDYLERMQGAFLAITCHRAQGSGSQAVVIVVESSRLVTREWIYTTITRSRELVILVGDGEALRKALARRTTRTTGFSLQARIPMGNSLAIR